MWGCGRVPVSGVCVMYAKITLYDGSGVSLPMAGPQSLADVCKALDTDGISYCVEYCYNGRLTLVPRTLTAEECRQVRVWHMRSYMARRQDALYFAPGEL